MSDPISGRVWKFGVDINTDLILPAPYMYMPQAEQARYVFQANRPGWVDEVRPGDFIVAGTNFGMGSSRPAPLALNGLRIGCLIADSINPLFLRNCVSFGLCAVECPGVSSAFEEGDVAEVTMETATVRNARTGVELTGTTMPGDLLNLMRGGGIFPLLEAEGLIMPQAGGTASAGAGQG
jgi:3-isopropylmalate/(R)-2-methylmalate dehydratase small subunit